MDNPIVAVVGRPNVGKSTFFNKMAGRRVSIVNDMPGVTRDRIYCDAEWCGYNFTLIDTGGIELRSEDIMWKHIRHQVDIAVETADVILFFVDGRQGVTPDDYDIATMLRRTAKPVVLGVNKIDGSDNSAAYDFYGLGLGEPIPVSAEHSLGLGDLLDEIVKGFKRPDSEEKQEEQITSIAVVGKPNAGKSSLVNKLLGYERVIVSDIAGTTRDAIDTLFTVCDKKYRIIDTAGIRKKAKVEEDVEYYSVIRSISAIRKADVVVIVMDATEGISEQDVKICGLAHDAGRPTVILMNKWDLVEKDNNTVTEFTNKLKLELKFMDYMKVVFASALTGKRVPMVVEAVDEVFANASRTLQTGILNEVIGDAISANEPPNRLGKKLKINFTKQVGTCPPAFMLFCNDPTIMHFSYKRYLENCLRKAFDFQGTPIKITLKGANEDN